MPTLKYSLNKNYDTYMTYNMLKNHDPAGHEYRLKKMGLPVYLGKLIQESVNIEDVKEVLLKHVDRKYEDSSKILFENVTNYQKAWDSIQGVFFSTVEVYGGIKWPHSEYIVYLSPINRGISNIDGNEVIRSCFENPLNQLRLTAHEITMIYWWNYIFSNFQESKDIKNWERYWGVNELMTNGILGLEEKLRDLWSKDTQGYDSYLQNYPQLKEKREYLKKIWNKQSVLKTFEKLLDKTNN